MAERLWRVTQVSKILASEYRSLFSHGETRVGSNPTPLISVFEVMFFLFYHRGGWDLEA